MAMALCFLAGFMAPCPYVFAKAELQRLVAYADARGVQVIKDTAVVGLPFSPATSAPGLGSPCHICNRTSTTTALGHWAVLMQRTGCRVSRYGQHGVQVMPELEGPGHSGAMRRSVPSFHGTGNRGFRGTLSSEHPSWLFNGRFVYQFRAVLRVDACHDDLWLPDGWAPRATVDPAR